ncbi:MAG: RNA polymerase sigma factor [Planctomycetota bacterium]|nr:RNA polymerase sigma factor [Planctomycetota bacterium]
MGSPDPPPPPPLTPEEIERLCAQAAGGEQEATTRLLAHYHHRLLGFTIRKVGVDWQGKLDPEDVLQEAYVGVFTGVGSFTYQGEDSFYYWVTKVIEHRFLDQVRALRRKKRDAAREVAIDPASRSRHQAMLDRIMPDYTTASRIIRREDAVAAMILTIASLPDDYREVLQRVYLNEQPIREAAAEMGRTEDAVRRLAGRAVERLAASMGHASRYLSGAG